HAQGFPEGSYLRSCTHVAVHGDRLLADCRRTDGSWERTALRDVDRCVGDIGNMNGQLACNRAERNYGSSRDRDTAANGWGAGMAMAIGITALAGAARLIITDTGEIGRPPVI